MRPSWLELRIPPLALLAMCMAAAEALGSLLPGLRLDFAFANGFAALIAVAGAALAVAGVLEFRRAQTTVDPRDPERATRVVEAGIYARTRNPMYLGMLFALVAFAFWRRNVAHLIVLPVFVGWLTRYQIMPEERLLAARFGLPYLAYCRRVRRWL